MPNVAVMDVCCSDLPSREMHREQCIGLLTPAAKILNPSQHSHTGYISPWAAPRQRFCMAEKREHCFCLTKEFSNMYSLLWDLPSSLIENFSELYCTLQLLLFNHPSLLSPSIISCQTWIWSKNSTCLLLLLLSFPPFIGFSSNTSFAHPIPSWCLFIRGLEQACVTHVFPQNSEK